MIRQFFNRPLQGALVAGLASALLLAQPAAAGRNDAAKVLTGVVGLAILAHIIDQQNGTRRATPQRQQPALPHRPVRARGGNGLDYSQCIRQQWTSNGWQPVLSQRCVARVNRHNGAQHQNRRNWQHYRFSN